MIPVLSAHARLRFDEVRGTWVLLAPERVIILDDIAYAVIEKIDGRTSIVAIAAALARDYEAPLDAITNDISDLLADLAAKGMVSL